MQPGLVGFILSMPVLAAGLAASAAAAAERTYSVTDFDRIVVDAPFAVSVVTGPPIGVRAIGAQQAIEGIAVSVANRTLRISRDKSAWGGWPGASVGRAEIRVTAPSLAGASLGGPGSLRIDRMAGPRLALTVVGTGSLAVGRLAAETLSVTMTGSGQVALAGTAKQARIVQRGSGSLAAGELAVEDLSLTAAGSGAVTVTALRSANVTAAGAGAISVTGAAACIVKSSGSGIVACGN